VDGAAALLLARGPLLLARLLQARDIALDECLESGDRPLRPLNGLAQEMQVLRHRDRHRRLVGRIDVGLHGLRLLHVNLFRIHLGLLVIVIRLVDCNFLRHRLLDLGRQGLLDLGDDRLLDRRGALGCPEGLLEIGGEASVERAHVIRVVAW
jgi:hypothetical protein